MRRSVLLLAHFTCSHLTFYLLLFFQVMDPRGYRRSKETFEGWSSDFYSRHCRLSASYYVFALLVMRGVLACSSFAPGEVPQLHNLPPGTVLECLPECQNYFLFCDDVEGVWLDCAPYSAQRMSNVTRILTHRMAPYSGQKARPSRAQRVSAGTNPTQRALMQSGGTRVDEALLAGVSRWGSWSGREGIQTVISHYER